MASHEEYFNSYCSKAFIDNQKAINDAHIAYLKGQHFDKNDDHADAVRYGIFKEPKTDKPTLQALKASAIDIDPNELEVV